MLCTVFSLAAFCFLAFHQMTSYRADNGLNKCYATDNSNKPVATVAGGLVATSDTVDVSTHWQVLFYANVGSSTCALVQIIVATIAFQSKKH